MPPRPARSRTAANAPLKHMGASMKTQLASRLSQDSRHEDASAKDIIGTPQLQSERSEHSPPTIISSDSEYNTIQAKTTSSTGKKVSVANRRSGKRVRSPSSDEMDQSNDEIAIKESVAENDTYHTPVKSTKRQRLAKPSPGSPAFKSMPAVMLPKVIPKPSREIGFGSIAPLVLKQHRQRQIMSSDHDEEAHDVDNIVEHSTAKGKAKQNFVYMEDLKKTRPYTPPTDEESTTAVMQEELQDKTISWTYANLPLLRPAQFQAWGSPDSGFPTPIKFSSWQSYLEPFDENKLIQWLTFQKSGQFVNLSRIDPESLSVSDSYGMSRYIVLAGQSQGYCVAVSLIYVHECALVNGKRHKDTLVKKLGGVLHSQELERMMGCVGMVFDFETVQANMFGWVMYFDTKKRDFDSRPNSPVKQSRPALPSFFNEVYAQNRVITSPRASTSRPISKPILDFNDTVPIYDARNHNFDPNKDMNRLSTLPLWKNGLEDAPRQSLAAVGYTVHTYKRSGGELCLSTNIQWLVVLGTCVVE